MAELKLLGSWPSPYSCRVIWALKLKCIPYEYVEEDLFNKSSLLLQSNPIHKKIPVLLHGGKPIFESTIILEYLEEIFPRNYPLLPKDPYERAIARFWIKFAEDKFPSVWVVYRTKGEEQEKAIKEALAILQTVEENAVGKKKFFGGEEINMMDIVFGALVHCLEAIEDVAGVKMLEAARFPRLHSWTKNFKEVPVIKENLPDLHKLHAYLKHRREIVLGSE